MHTETPNQKETSCRTIGKREGTRLWFCALCPSNHAPPVHLKTGLPSRWHLEAPVPYAFTYHSPAAILQDRTPSAVPERSKNGAKKKSSLALIFFFPLLGKKRRKINPTTQQTRETDQYIMYISWLHITMRKKELRRQEPHIIILILSKENDLIMHMQIQL